MKLKKLPLGIQIFSDIINDNMLYIDKTKEALNLIEEYRYVFLSRPRRFGKSLFVSTLREIFEGNKEIFKDLYIYNKWDWSVQYPVITIDFAKSRIEDRANLDDRILKILKENQDNLGIECKYIDDTAGCFRELIIQSYKKYNQKVVVLIDEYDKPILDNIEDADKANKIRDGLYNLYSVLKGSGEYLEFVFITGVSKFAKASIFSGLNNIQDVSLHPRYAEICGYTQNDIETTLQPYLQDVDLEELKFWYDGYNFLGQNLYNPYGILLFIDSCGVYKNYWFETGTPTFLINLIKSKKYYLPNFENIEMDEKLTSSFNLDKINIETLMFQAGYLTIKKTMQRGRKIKYKLGFPNFEVESSFYDYILDEIVDRVAKSHIEDELWTILESGNLKNLEQLIKKLFSSIAYNNFTNNYIENYEGFYASVIYAFFASMGLELKAEDVTNKGRIDLTLKFGNRVYIFEFKVIDEDPLKQIKEKRYFEKYSGEVFIIGIVFDKQERNVSGFKWERV